MSGEMSGEMSGKMLGDITGDISKYQERPQQNWFYVFSCHHFQTRTERVHISGCFK